MSDPVRLAVLGDPLEYTLSPLLHRAGLEAVGLAGESEAMRTPLAELGVRLSHLARHGYRGVNLTHPLKPAAREAVARRSNVADRAESVNTIGFDPAGWWGDTTDGPGFLDLLESIGRPAMGQRAVLIGAGGAARALAVSLGDAGARISILARRPEPSSRWGGSSVPVAPFDGADADAWLADATLVVNATPVSTDLAPLDPRRIADGALVVDLVYRSTLSAWASTARAAGYDAFDGLGLLVFQARRSLALWLGQDPGVEPLARAVGWPR